MQTATAKPNQSTLDIVLMHCGTMEAAMEVMAANTQSITAAIAVGDEYKIPATTTDNTTLSYLKQNRIVIGTQGD